MAKKATDPVGELVQETIDMKKQALVFVNAKRSAEAVAEDLAKRYPVQYPDLAKKVLKALQQPTKQCRRLAFCIERGTAFHHAGLVAKQRHLIEEAFNKGELKVIAATPTLAMGVNTSAFRVIIRDLHRFDGYMQEIQVLEYLQMAGRAGRPDFHDTHGEAITIAKTTSDGEWIKERYWEGEPEPIYSKLASLPALRTAVLSLYASRFVKSRKELLDFFSRTFFAYQYRNTTKLNEKILDVEEQLEEWGFLHSEQATPIGRRVSQLYIDPYSAHLLLEGIQSKKPKTDLGILHLVCSCIELRPLLRLKANDFAQINPESVLPEPSMFSAEYEEYMAAAKTANMLSLWLDEAPEERILEEYDVRPGELRSKIDTGDWLLYSAVELCKLLGTERTAFLRCRLRLKYGVKPEIIPLLRIRGVGRVRARKLYRAGLTSIQQVAAASETQLAKLLGPTTAFKVRQQLAGSAARKL
jgi:helicase